MKDYVLYGLDGEKHDVLLLCLSHENVFTFYEDVQKEPVIQNGTGTILLDQLLVTGNGENRFVTLPYNQGMIDFSRAENATVNHEIRRLSVELLNKYITSLQDTILTEAQQEMVQNKTAI